jgi:hypothetical protein
MPSATVQIPVGRFPAVRQRVLAETLLEPEKGWYLSE